ncbi:hypothetical protein LO771_29690 [Streptacidiphilus sp. ASG 303]|uniref:hypothetical protein n=1 Tax=Streptacidiphilus sp. ASG 303 TaxID=2896847 RepID=UPI001E526BAB|nr:hypothetical protein [Streptacidiphilus sp. ASG 303]MCD0486441.1 hypothetical protein [Streptacidiphilus sp. ASG 303]
MQSPTRRAVLGAAVGGAVLTLGACSADAPAPAGTAAPDPDLAVRRRAVEATAALAAAYDAVLTAHPTLAGRLQPLRDQVLRHRAALAAGLPEGGTPPAATAPGTAPAPGGPSGTGAPAAPPTASAAAVPAAPAAALASLAAAERRTAASRTAALDTASPELARLLASLAACGTVHALALGP